MKGVAATVLAGLIALAAGVAFATADDPPSPAPAGGIRVDEVHLKALKARSIGPAVMSGRVSDVALHPSDPYTFHIALGTGGVMKTTDGGATFAATFDKEAVAAVGAIEVAPSDPNIVWVGTGEANDRNSSSWGDGVYRSTDGGETWRNTGLRTSRTIARIVAHPKDPATAWVAATGDLWSPGGERGLFRTTDGGGSWKAVLRAPAPFDDRVGCGDVAIDPANPDVVYAALYARRRTPWSFTSGPAATGGEDLGGIFKSVDGGRSWKKLRGGLPGSTGRIGLAVFPANPKILYAVVQSDEGGASSIREMTSRAGGVFRSEDAGETWKRVNPLNPRAFYFSQIRVDPENDKRVYLLAISLHVSDDGGRTFREDLFKNVHPDCHAMEIDPANPKRILLGTDGGPYLSHDGGKGWEHLNRFAAGEFYRINLDMSRPYRICGGLQDNLNWVGPSRTWSKEGIRHGDWINIGGGDGFYCVFDPNDPDIVYAESQRGWVYRFNLANGQRKTLRPNPAEGQPAFRFHWNSPLIGSVHDGSVMYLAGNRVFRLTRRGEHWKLISPDLSSRDPEKTTAVGSGAETYGVVYTLAESPLRAGHLWAGTDDGKLWHTTDDGGNWTDLTGSLPAAVRGKWISFVEPSFHDPAVAYLASDAHRTGDDAPHLFRTGDGGRTWRRISSNLPAGGPVKVVREDPVNPDLLFAGTEFGLFASLDRGGTWVPFGGLPTVAVDHLVIHPREKDLVIATHGRSLYIVDDLGPLEGMTPEVSARPAHLFAPRPVFGRHLLEGFGDWNGNAVYRGENPPEGALIGAWVREYTGDEVKISIKDEHGKPVANLTLPGTPGINRTNWDLRPTEDLLVEYGGEGKKFVGGGDYTVTMTYGEVEQTRTLSVTIAEGVETR